MNSSRPSIRAKFLVVVVDPYEFQGVKQGENISLIAVYGNNPGNESWAQATPSGTLNMYINNPDAFGVFQVGQEYFLDFTKAVE